MQDSFYSHLASEQPLGDAARRRALLVTDPIGGLWILPANCWIDYDHRESDREGFLVQSTFVGLLSHAALMGSLSAWIYSSTLPCDRVSATRVFPDRPRRRLYCCHHRYIPVNCLVLMFMERPAPSCEQPGQGRT